jgi:hypothetical protein
MITEEELKNVSLSEATMRPQDLIPVFIYAIRQIDPDNEVLMDSMDKLEKDIEDNKNPDYYESEDCSWDLDYLFDILNELAPEGYYFGSHPGDGSDYGFWECEEDF